MDSQTYNDFTFSILSICFVFIVLRYGSNIMYWIGKITDGGHGEAETKEEYLERTGMPDSLFLPFMIFSFWAIIFSFLVTTVIITLFTYVSVLSFVELTAINLDVITRDELPWWGVSNVLDQPLVVLPLFLTGLAIVTMTFSAIFSAIDGWLTGNSTKPVKLEEKQIKTLRLFLENIEVVEGSDDDSDDGTPMDGEE